MNVLLLLLFVSASLVALALGLFAWTVRGRTFQHGHRLALLPLDDAKPASTDPARAGSALDGSAHPAESCGTKDE
ncbi:MAG: cytochrome oxidase [Myxococcota bacterium]